MWPWLLALVAGGVAISKFASSEVDSSEILIHQAVQEALAKETNKSILISFATKLRAAGYDVEANEIAKKAG